VYLKNLSKALVESGHRVEIITGPPDPQIDNSIPVHHLTGLDLYNPDDPFRTPDLKELADSTNFLEWLGVSTMGFPEPLTFGIRAFKFLQNRLQHYDIIHDNQSLSYGIRRLSRHIPVIATIHHPITRDRAIAIQAADSFWKKLQQMRWYSFVNMQKKVSRTLSHIITVSKCARDDISHDFEIPVNRFRIAPNGIDTTQFYPLPEIRRQPDRLIVTTSADTPLKGLRYLLIAVSRIVQKRKIKLLVVGAPRKNGSIQKLVRQLGIGHCVRFTGTIDNGEFVRQYAKATAAVIPSLYEGFGLPAGEAMACATPVISTTGGALPEVVGNAGILVPPADTDALTAAILRVLDNPDEAYRLGLAGYNRVRRHFTWRNAAETCVAAYREAIRDYR
jgi:glycosyltransferase involved in cell wall biosynthesis